MTSVRKIEANRRNAQKSTGPKTDCGKQRASLNAIRHGLTAETVVTPLEDPEDYKAFEQAIISDFEAETAVERELCLRLASLLWRLRRAVSIETGLLQIHCENLREPCATRQAKTSEDYATTIFRFGQPAEIPCDDAGCEHRDDRDAIPEAHGTRASPAPDLGQKVARCFLRQAELDNGVFERLGRYEAALWRQARQTLFTLEGLRGRTSSPYRWGRKRQFWHRTLPPEPD
jgi:hypothetical protein